MGGLRSDRRRPLLGVSQRGREYLRSAVSEKPLRCDPQDSALNRAKLVNLTGITKKVCDNGALGARPEGESLDTLVA